MSDDIPITQQEEEIEAPKPNNESSNSKKVDTTTKQQKVNDEFMPALGDVPVDHKDYYFANW